MEFQTEVIGDLIEPITLNIDVWKLVNLYWFTVRTPIPGCCSFENICDMLGGGHPSNFSCPVGTAENCIECTCPPLPGRYNTSVTPVVVNVDELPYYVRLFIKLFASGKYETRFTMTDGKDDLVLCMETSMEIATSAEDTSLAERRPVLDKLPDYCYRNNATKPTQSNDVY
ncbi:uncharacterized protein LOC117120651 [Anneissia japonica]|uniref:uncharacterized protein LOC117120651 n=1 Tax=Anneissia japonica TaxID=1529436 RepID=UPI0014256370|nr:uncharacterized protein LOC117120651 [Anneissia japonica]